MKPNNKRPWQIPLAIALLIFGFLITIQYNTQVQLNNSLQNQKTEDLVALVKSLNENRNSLESELAELTNTYSSLDLQDSLEKQIQQLSCFIGTVPVTGPGITITITGDSPILNVDLVDIINELRVTGAEAIAINDTRVTAYTSIAHAVDANNNPFITINGNRLLTPIVIKAIGKAETLKEGLTFPGGILDNLNTLYSIYPTIKEMDTINIPAANVITDPIYKKVYTAPVASTTSVAKVNPALPALKNNIKR